MTDGGSPTPIPLQNLLVEEVAQLRGFLVLLETEQQALIDGDVDRLLPLAAEKNDIFGRLARLSEARGKTLVGNGLSADRQGMDNWLKRHPEMAEARKAWEELVALAEKGSAMNQTNGKLIATRLANNQQALSTLLAAANQAALYGPDGQARPVGGGRSLGSV